MHFLNFIVPQISYLYIVISSTYEKITFTCLVSTFFDGTIELWYAQNAKGKTNYFSVYG